MTADRRDLDPTFPGRCGNCGALTDTLPCPFCADVPIHVYPVGDLVEHDTDGDDCVCGPTSESVKRDNGSIGWVVVHHSLDGREASE